MKAQRCWLICTRPFSTEAKQVTSSGDQVEVMLALRQSSTLPLVRVTT